MMRIASTKNRKSKIDNARRAATLTEVLIAIFVMGIGMISLLTLFPVGIYNMASSIRNNRAANVGYTAESLAEYRGVRGDSVVMAVARAFTDDAYQNMNPAILPNTPAYELVVLPNSAVPVFVDPIGVDNGWGATLPPSASLYNVGKLNPPPPPFGLPPYPTHTGIPRATVSFAPAGSGQAQRWFIQHDEVNFNMNGTAYLNPAAPLVERDRRYSFLYVWRRPRISEPTVAELSIVIFDGRKLAGGGLASTLPGEVPLYGVLNQASGKRLPVFDPVSRPTTAVIVVTSPSQMPPVRRGYWILDASVVARPFPLDANSSFELPPPYNPAIGDFRGYPPPYFNGFFYQIVDVAEPTGPNANNEWEVKLELDRPVRNPGFVGVMIANIVDVIEKSDGKTP